MLSSDDAETNEEALYRAATMAENEAHYLLTVECDAKDVGFDIGEFLWGEITNVAKCRATLSATIDKKSMKCVSSSLEINVDDVNQILTEADVEFEVLKLYTDVSEFSFEAVEIALPEID